MRKLSLLFLAALALGTYVWSSSTAGTFSQVGSGKWVTVSKVYDGDTFKTRDGEKVRLLGINTPETAHGSTPGQPLANQAKRELTSLLLGKSVRLEFDQEKHDTYGRLLAHVYLRDDSWINGRMIEAGLSHTYTFPPNFAHSDQLLAREQQARAQRLGIWNTPFYQLLTADAVSDREIGQFRVIEGKAAAINRNGWGFKLGKLSVTIPRANRKWFKHPPKLNVGDSVTVHGRIRISNQGNLYLALHSPYDLELMKR